MSAGVLWLIGQIDAAMPFSEILGKVVVEGVIVAIGLSVGAAQLGGGGKGSRSGQGMKGKRDRDGRDGRDVGLRGRVVLSICGAVLFASNVAPTEEIVMIAVEASRWQILGLALLSLALGGIILFYSDFTGSQRPAREGHATTVLSFSVINYAVALAASAFILWFFGRFEGVSLSIGVAETVALGVAGTLGASAGRLLLVS